MIIYIIVIFSFIFPIILFYIIHASYYLILFSIINLLTQFLNHLFPIYIHLLISILLNLSICLFYLSIYHLSLLFNSHFTFLSHLSYMSNVSFIILSFILIIILFFLNLLSNYCISLKSELYLMHNLTTSFLIKNFYLITIFLIFSFLLMEILHHYFILMPQTVKNYLTS